MREKNIKKVIISAEEKVKLNFTDVLLIGITFSMVFFTGMFPIETTENKEVFYAFYCFTQDFSDDYNELSAKY